MYSILDKDTIEMEIVPFILKTKRGFPLTVPVAEIVSAIPYKLKKGGAMGPVATKGPLFRGGTELAIGLPPLPEVAPLWAWKDCWTKFLNKYRVELDLSSVDLDGSHAPAIRGGHCAEYQGRKRRNPPMPFTWPIDGDCRWPCPNPWRATTMTFTI